MTTTTIITTVSMLAVIVGIVAIAAQMYSMHSSRSSAGQSSLGWTLGLTTNASMAFVNTVGYHATILALGNLLSLLGCTTALVLVRRYRAAHPPVAPAPARPMPAQPLAPAGVVQLRPVALEEMHTQEFVALRDVVLAEHARRATRRQGTVAVAA